MLGQPGAVARRPPHRAATTEPGATQVDTVTSASQTFAVIKTGAPLAPLQGSWVTFVSSVDAYICFGDASVGAATSNDYPLFANVEKEWFLDDRIEPSFSIIRAGAVDGTIKRYKSDRH